MASGLPTVCADASGSNSLVLHGKTGFLATPGDADVFATSVAELIGNPALRKQMSRSAHDASGAYSWPNILSRLVKYYDEVLEQERPPSALPEPVFETPLVRNGQQPVSVGY
jgi:glycosyltransferase involved in cell wall biosynthesis